MTAIACTLAALWAIPFVVVAPALLELERDLEARIAEPEDEEPVANDNDAEGMCA